MSGDLSPSWTVSAAQKGDMLVMPSKGQRRRADPLIRLHSGPTTTYFEANILSEKVGIGVPGEGPVPSEGCLPPDNKCQGQTMQEVGVYLPSPVFTHGQLYVAVTCG